jgi:uncharacterized protein YceH (UPF0502 family)
MGTVPSTAQYLPTFRLATPRARMRRCQMYPRELVCETVAAVTNSDGRDSERDGRLVKRLEKHAGWQRRENRRMHLLVQSPLSFFAQVPSVG